MKKKILLTCGILLCVAIFVVVSHSNTEAKDLELLGGAGSVHQTAVAIADILTKNHPELRVSATGTASTPANIAEMLKKDPNEVLYMVASAPYKVAKAGLGEFKKIGAIDDQRLIAGFQMGANGWVTCDPNIKTLSDLDGKSIAMVGDELPKKFAKSLFEILGINVKIYTMGFEEQFNALADGLVSACMFFATGVSEGAMMPVSALQQVMLQRDVYAISIPGNLQEQAVKKAGLEDLWPYVPVTLPAEILPKQEEPFEVYVATVIMLACHADADADLVYEITKTIAENIDLFSDYSPMFADLKVRDLRNLLNMIKSEDEIHPGALKYYKEIGLSQ